MALYRAQEIKDRVAQGDDLYQITDAGGKKKLTPSPTEVSEAGTEINKALLQPLVDAVERIDKDVDPYRLYWWRQRTTANSYSEVRMTASNGLSFTYSQGGNSYTDTWYYCLYQKYKSENSELVDEITSCTLQYASQISVNQSTGAVTLIAPHTITITNDNYRSVNSAGTLNGKYVKGLYPSTTTIYYIPDDAYLGGSGAYANGTYDQYFTGFMQSTNSRWGATNDIQTISSVKVTALGDWELISSANSDQYPHSGTQNGMEYQYLGKINEIAAKAAPYAMQSVSITAANYSGGSCSVSIPCDRYLIWITGSSLVGYDAGMVDNGTFYGTNYKYGGGTAVVFTTYTSLDYPDVKTGIYFSTAGITVKSSSSASLTIKYLPIS